MQPARTAQNRIWALDLLKTIAIIGVIMTHLVYNDLGTAIKRWLDGGNAVGLFLVVNGFTYALSLQAHRVDTLRRYFTGHLWRHLRSILWTFLVAFGFEIFYHSFLITWMEPHWLWMEVYDPDIAYKYYYRVREIVPTVLQGGLGPGAYYIPLIITLAFLFPFLYYAYKKCRPAVIGAALVLLAAEYNGVSMLGMGTWLHRLCYVLIGVILYDLYQQRHRLPWYAWTGLAAAVFAVGVLDRIEVIRLFNNGYYLYVGGFAALALCLARPPQPKNLFLRLPRGVITLIGSASYHIYLAQKVYCSTQYPAWFWENYQVGEWGHLCIALLAGLLFYLVDSRITRFLFPRVDALLLRLRGPKQPAPAQPEGK